MKKILFGISILAILLSSKKVLAQSPAEIVGAIVSEASTTYKVDADVMWRTLWCESRFVFDAHGDPNLGHSFGVAQINLRWHPEITYEQAINPVFAIDFMAREMAAGRANKWTCYRQLFGTSTDLAIKGN